MKTRPHDLCPYASYPLFVESFSFLPFLSQETVACPSSSSKVT